MEVKLVSLISSSTSKSKLSIIKVREANSRGCVAGAGARRISVS